MKELKGFNFHANTNRDGLQGIYSRNTGELPCQSRTLIAVSIDGEIIAKVTGSTLYYRGNTQSIEKKFGDQLEQKLGKRFGY